MNDIKASEKGMQIKTLTWKSDVFWQLMAVIFVLVWTLNFIGDKTGFICMISASHFYFTSGKDREGSGHVMEAV
mgnify:CR=1 FL=1